MSSSLYVLCGDFVNRCKQHFICPIGVLNPVASNEMRGQVNLNMWDSLFECDGSSTLIPV
jgi:hypothetical protein